ncbi:hypothetical protein KBC99_00385 [Candidatus Saccharibacteria bacterium]|nr:hypothetical protein [Candidatus Saccharibacteria bacterium]
MAKRKSDSNTQMFGFLLVALLIILTVYGQLVAQLGLAVVLMVGSIWGLARSKQTWVAYVAHWKKLPKSKKNFWNEPQPLYYYFNVIFLLPMLFVLGMALLILAYAQAL